MMVSRKTRGCLLLARLGRLVPTAITIPTRQMGTFQPELFPSSPRCSSLLPPSARLGVMQGAVSTYGVFPGSQVTRPAL